MVIFKKDIFILFTFVILFVSIFSVVGAVPEIEIVYPENTTYHEVPVPIEVISNENVDFLIKQRTPRGIEYVFGHANETDC